jgi:hypothetical protein
MPDWVKDLSIGATAVIRLVTVVIAYIKANPSRKTPCSANLSPILIENTKIMAQLSTMIQTQQVEFKETNAKTQEVLQNLVMSTHELVILTRELSTRVK